MLVTANRLRQAYTTFWELADHEINFKFQINYME